jgi:Fuc2NAc and GlcNAc transferase
MMTAILLPIAALLLSWRCTGMFRRYALSRDLIDRPNLRSSHSVPTPRGGGMAIVLTFTAALPLLVYAGALERRQAIAAGVAGAIAALVGFLDDHRPIPPSWRFAGHIVSAAVLVWGTLTLPAMTVFGLTLNPGPLSAGLTIVYIVWLINLTNFMDGIAGLAAVEVVAVCAWGACLYTVVRPGTPEPLAPLVLAAAALGFLYWNWPPARVFLGDGGSGFLGLMIGAMALQAGARAESLFWSWTILFGVFIVDASVTLVRRALQGARLHEAHRSHAYQHAAQRFASHRVVTMSAAAITLLWLGPLALLVCRGVVGGAAGLVIAYAPLTVLAIRLHAGRRGEVSPAV